MKITDEEALKELSRTRSGMLWEDISEYPEDEREERSDFEFIADECSYILSCFEEDGHVYAEDLKRAKEVLRETKRGKVIPLWPGTLMPKYSKSDICIAKDSINEFNRLKSLMKRLNSKGYFGKW